MRWAALVASVGLLGAGGASAASVVDTPAQLSALPAAATVLMVEGSGAIIYSRNANAELAIASTTKLMTAYVTLQREPLDARLVEQPYAAGVGESLAPVPAGAMLTVPDMLRAMLLPSGNNVAYSLSIDVGGTESNFIAMMNAAAAKLHLGRTHYTTPIGLDTPGDNYSTAADLARLTRVLMRRPLFREIVDQTSARLADGIVVDNRNDLVGAYPWIVGVKTGTTDDAGECMVAATNLGGVRLISVVLGAPSDAVRDADTLALLRYGLSLYRSAQVTLAGQVYATVPVKGRTMPARLVAQRSFGLVLTRTATLHAALVVPSRLVGPIPAGTVEGSIDVTENGRAVATVALVTSAAVPAPRPERPVAHQPPPLVGPAHAGAASTTAPGCSLPVVRARRMRCARRMQR
jgi:D-alanyl-D-alanine carboxypeptidase (penicillin-binding protein 5/6)